MTATADALMAIFGFKRVEESEMSKKNDGGPAFPHHFTQDSVGDCKGMTLRDYFAAKAMQAYLGGNDRDDFEFSDWAEASYIMADAMLAERESQQ